MCAKTRVLHEKWTIAEMRVRTKGFLASTWSKKLRTNPTILYKVKNLKKNTHLLKIAIKNVNGLLWNMHYGGFHSSFALDFYVFPA